MKWWIGLSWAGLGLAKLWSSKWKLIKSQKKMYVCMYMCVVYMYPIAFVEFVCIYIAISNVYNPLKISFLNFNGNCLCPPDFQLDNFVLPIFIFIFIYLFFFVIHLACAFVFIILCRHFFYSFSDFWAMVNFVYLLVQCDCIESPLWQNV